MSKREFLEELKLALAGRVSAGEVQEHLNYYEDYINTQVRMGNREEDVVAGLGEPRLLARNIAESKKYASGNSTDAAYAQNTYDRNTYEQNQTNGKVFKMPGWMIVFIIIFVVILFFGLVFSVLSFLAPVMVPVLIILFVIRMLKK